MEIYMTKFNHTAKRLSKINMAYLAKMANLAYEPKEKINTELAQLGFTLPQDKFYFSDKTTNTQGFIVGDKHKIIISFTGTEGKIADWVTDLKVFKETWTEANPLGQVHNGFYQALSSVWKKLLTELNSLRTNNQSIWITGHSLGGALATLAAATLHLQSPTFNIGGVYTFGCPRVANHKFSKNYNQKLKDITFRCVNNNDVVTRVPPQIFGYSHVGKILYFDADGKLKTDNNLSWWARFWDRLEGRYDNIFTLTPDGVGDHSMDIYQKLSNKLL
jgi:triacylglycerol lipase